MYVCTFRAVSLTIGCLVSGLFESLRGQQEDQDQDSRDDESKRPKPFKRTRTVSPDYSKQQDPKARRLARERLKREKLRKELHDRRQDMEDKFMEEVYAEAAAPHGAQFYGNGVRIFADF